MRDTYEEYEHPREDWLRALLNRVLYILVFLAILISLFCWFLPLVRERQREQRALQALTENVEQQRSLLNKQTRKLNLLRNDPGYLELMARDKLDLQKPGETIFRVDPPADKTP